jgi:hypothetical protein
VRGFATRRKEKFFALDLVRGYRIKAGFRREPLVPYLCVAEFYLRPFGGIYEDAAIRIETEPDRLRLEFQDPVVAFARIAAAKAPFASRGDDSGTNRMELRLWKSAGIQPDPHSGWYRDLGQGMGPTLNVCRDGETMLKGVDAAHVAAIERLQPYNGCHWTARLRDLSNMDKHRHIVPGGGIMKGTVYSGLSTDLSRIHGAFDRKARHPITGEDVNVKVHVASELLFTDGTPVIQTLQEIQTGVADMLRQYEPEFRGRID